RAPRAHGAELLREPLALAVARAGEREDAPPLVARHLRHEMRRRAEAVQPQPLPVPRGHERAVADQPGTEERRSLGVAVALGQGEAVARVGHRVLGVPAVDLIAREARPLAQVLAGRAAEAALAARPAEPGHAHPVAQRDAIDARTPFIPTRSSPAASSSRRTSPG